MVSAAESRRQGGDDPCEMRGYGRLLQVGHDPRHSPNEYSPLVVWNFVVGAVYVLSVGAAANGAGKVSAGEQDGASLSAH